MKKMILTFVLSLLMVQFTFAQTDYNNKPGYVDFSGVEKIAGDESMSKVFLEKHLLKLAASMTEEEDPELQALLENIDLINVNSFNVNEKNGSMLKKKVEEINENLLKSKWDRIVYTKEADQQTSVFVKAGSGDEVLGMTVISYNPKGDAAFVNIVGNISMKNMGKLAKNFNFPGMNVKEKDSKEEKSSKEEQKK